MSTERVTVSLPDDLRRGAQRIAEERGTSFSAVVAEALIGWMRGRLADAWLAEHRATHGEFDESCAGFGEMRTAHTNHRQQTSEPRLPGSTAQA